MKEPLHILVSAGTMARPWALRLVEDWRLDGINAELEPNPAADPFLVDLQLPDDIRYNTTLHLDRRRHETAGPYLAFQWAAENLRAKKDVDFEDLAHQAVQFLQNWSIFPGSLPKLQNNWITLQDLLEKVCPAAAISLVWLISEAFPLSAVSASSSSLLPANGEPSSALLRSEARRLYLEAAQLFFTDLKLDESRELRRDTTQILKQVADPGIGHLIAALQGAALVEENYRRVDKGFARIQKAQQRAEKAGDAPTALAIALMTSRLHYWRKEIETALEVLTTAITLAETKAYWCPPRLYHLQRLHRAQVAPSVETLEPLVEEILEFLERGDGGWLDSLDHLHKTQITIGTPRFVELLAHFMGQHNAAGLAKITRQGASEDSEREYTEKREAEEEKRRAERPFYLWGHG